MYGQTEASPRISFLPPDLVGSYPGSIGRAIPGGKLYLLDENGRNIDKNGLAGVLVYEGSNVMMGYAIRPDQLSSDDTPNRLLTGDIACRGENDLFYIVGRINRFVKPFGIRINLDDVQSYIKNTHTLSAVTGDDNHIIVALPKTQVTLAKNLSADLAKKYSLPKTLFTVTYYTEIPLLSNGKYNYKLILDDHSTSTQEPSAFSLVMGKIYNVLELNDKDWDSVLEIFESVLNIDNITLSDSFNSLGADSLSFVTLSINLEECFGDDLPKDWRDFAISSLEELYRKTRYHV